MKLLKIIATLVLPLLIMQSCDKAEFEVQTEEGGLIEIKNSALNYVVGNTGPYTSTIRIFQGEIKTEKVEVYGTFYSTRQDTVIATDEVVNTQLISNTVLFTTITPSLTENSVESFSFTFDDLYAPFTIETEVYPDGLTAADVIKGATNTDLGDALPATDGEYKIGDNWSFEYRSTTSDGRTVVQAPKTNVGVSTRYAGSYNILAGYYFGPDGLRDPAIWVGIAPVNIVSVDATTYSWSVWGFQFYSTWGTANDNNLYFQVDPVTDKITYLPDQLLNSGNPILTVELNVLDLQQAIPLAGANINSVIKDDVEGKDQLNMVFGYFYAGSGPREFYFFLEKIVN